MNVMFGPFFYLCNLDIVHGSKQRRRPRVCESGVLVWFKAKGSGISEGRDEGQAAVARVEYKYKCKRKCKAIQKWRFKAAAGLARRSRRRQMRGERMENGKWRSRGQERMGEIMREGEKEKEEGKKRPHDTSSCSKKRDCEGSRFGACLLFIFLRPATRSCSLKVTVKVKVKRRVLFFSNVYSRYTLLYTRCLLF